MTKEALLLKYIDGELSPKEKIEVEQLLSKDETFELLFRKVEASRRKMLQALDLLNPEESLEIPLFTPNIDAGKKRKTFQFSRWHYAALAAIFIGIFFGLKLFQPKNEKMDTAIITNNIEELDYYISPNRCWNKKQLEWTFFEINH